MRRTDSVQLLQKLLIVNQFYASLEEQDLQQFTHDQLRKLSTVLSKLDPKLLQGQNKKIHEILIQRSYAHIKNFANKYKGFKFNVNMFQNGYHRQIVEARFKKPKPIPNPLSSTIGVATIEPYQDIIGTSSKTKETPQNAIQIPQRQIVGLKDQAQVIQQNINVAQNQYKQGQSLNQGQKNNLRGQVKNDSVAVNIKNRDWNELSSEEEDYLEIKDEETLNDENQLNDKALPKNNQESIASFDIDDSEQQDEGRLISVHSQTEKPQHIFQFNEQEMMGNIMILKHLDSQQRNRLNENKDQGHTQNILSGLQETKQNKDSDNQSFELENEDPINQWIKDNQNESTHAVQNIQLPLNKHVDSSVQSFSPEEDNDDQDQDFDEKTTKRMEEQTNKQIHPTLRHFYEENQKNIIQNSKSNKDKNQTHNNSHKIDNPMDYKNNRQFR